MKKLFLKLLLVFFLSLIFIYVVAITAIPNEIVLFNGENLNIKTIFGLDIVKVDSVEVSSSSNSKIDEQETEQTKEVYSLNLFNTFLLKEIDVDIIPKDSVIPVGSLAGLKLYTSGVLVVGMSEIQGIDSEKYKPYIDSSIEEGDTILKINNVDIFSTEDLKDMINKTKGNEISITYFKNEQIEECKMTPIQTAENEYKLGLWVRDSAAGVGTVTFYDPNTEKFAALGHGISDIDTNELLNISSGEFVTTDVLDITKGENGNPGKIQGIVSQQSEIGEIYKNSEFGVFGEITNLDSLDLNQNKEYEVALRDEIKIGKASILCDVDGKGVEEYEIEIQKIYVENNYDNKSMKIKVTDEDLIEKTGGIIQGMSGAPILQNGKFIGAVTNVLINNPEEGYGIFGDIMIKEMRY